MFIKVRTFSLDKTLGCGQAFRWKKKGEFWEGVVKGKFIRLRQEGNKLFYEGNAELNLIKHYLSLDIDYDKVLFSIGKDSIINKCVSFYKGMRLLRQDAFECSLSYILSVNNSFKNISMLVERLSERYGDPLYFDGREYYSFPEPEKLYSLSVSDYRSLGFGFRAKWIYEFIKSVQGGFDIYSLKNLPYDEAKEILMSFNGIGHKVADCILAFSLEKMEAFPVDRWVRRFMLKHYFKSKQSDDKIRSFAREYFSPYPAYAQEFIFYCSWDHPF
ncbi:DNA-3-methyladenine glycosylase 2 family protein [Candidatus Micrarchaeota archaeon]|nr:MAG: DNA-3-methyladenine glycosylase 2 family protein [Candidatus Micrarchaeota archaeon]